MVVPGTSLVETLSTSGPFMRSRVGSINNLQNGTSCPCCSPFPLFPFSVILSYAEATWVTQEKDTTYRAQRESHAKLTAALQPSAHNTPAVSKPRPHTCKNQEIALGPEEIKILIKISFSFSLFVIRILNIQ